MKTYTGSAIAKAAEPSSKDYDSSLPSNPATKYNIVVFLAKSLAFSI